MKLKYINTIGLILAISQQFAFCQSEKKELRSGNQNYSQGKYKESEKNYSEALKKNPNYLKANYNLGASLYKQGKFTEASNQFELSTNGTTSKDTLAMILHNQGTSMIKEKK